MASKAEQSTRTKAALVEAATALFSERGYRATSIKAIAARAGISHGVIPFHFGSKEGLLDAVVEGCFETFQAAVFAPLGARERDFGIGDLGAFMRAQVTFQDEHPEVGRLFQVLMFEALGPTPELLPRFRALHERLRALGCAWMRAGRDEGSLADDLDVEAVVDAMLCFFAGVRTHSLLLAPGSFDREAVHDQMLRILERGVRPEEDDG